MADMFKRTSPGMRFLSGLGTLILCNLLFIITSIPIFTIGASLTAMYRITFDMHIDNAFALNEKIETFENVYYFS